VITISSQLKRRASWTALKQKKYSMMDLISCHENEHSFNAHEFVNKHMF
jgi:hypothetical protein